jgi:prephenate dehydrogenase
VKLGVIGLGLIGGSIGRAFLDADWQVYGYDPDKAATDLATECGIDCQGSWQSWLCAVDQVAIASPLAQSGLWIRRVAQQCSDGITVVDVSSVKGPLQADYELIHEPSRLLCLHPMAGKEVRGFAASDPALFRDHPCLVVNWPGRAVDDALLGVWMDILGTRAVRVAGDAHDTLVSLVSHMPYLVSASLLAFAEQSGSSCPQWPLAAGTGFLDTTRVGASDIALWMEILNGNCQNIKIDFARFAALIGEWNDLIQHGQWPPGLTNAATVRQQVIETAMQGASYSEGDR